LDVGSNSVILFIAEADESGNFRTVEDQTDMPRLGEGVNKTGIISPSAMERTLEVLSNFASLAKDSGVGDIAAVGTSTLRQAKNAAQFLEKVKNRCGLEIRVISGEEEARLSYIAVKKGLNLQSENLVVIDIGGASTEFIYGKGDRVENSFSINIGTIRLTETYLISDPVTQSEYGKMMEYVRGVFQDLPMPEKTPTLVGMGGTMTNLGAIKHRLDVYDPTVIQGSKLELGEIESQIKAFCEKTIEERKQIKGLQPKRADVILASAGILLSIMIKLNVKEVIISDQGIRHGLMYDRFLR
jgi:exopolyphosphatase/guanosine-5'-triphosphate,3'-diphosphate pyrophosphatase